MKEELKFQNRYRIPSNRLSGWMYNAEGTYFLTVCSYNREYLFGEIVDSEMILNELGHVVREEWEKSAHIRSEIILGPYVIMPNHFHAIVHIVENDLDDEDDLSGFTGRDARPCVSTIRQMPSRLPKSVSSLMAGFKSVVTKKINLIRNMPGSKVWQSNYYDHIIRNNEEYQRISDYINTNPECWQSDSLF